MSANSKYYLISTRGEVGQENSGAGDDADKNKTGVVADKNEIDVEANKKKTGVKANKNKTGVKANKNKIGAKANKNKTGVDGHKNKTDVDLHHEAGRDYAMYEDDYGYYSSNNYSSYYQYDYDDIEEISYSKFQGVKKLT